MRAFRRPSKEHFASTRQGATASAGRRSPPSARSPSRAAPTRRSGQKRQRAQPPEGGEQRLCPRPAPRQVQGQAPPGAREPPGDVQQPLAQPLRLRPRELALEAERRRVGEQVLGHEHELEPDRVRLELAEGQVREAALARAADRVLDARVRAVAGLERGYVASVLVGDQALEAVALVIGEGELRAGCGRSRRQISRVPAGHSGNETTSVSSATQAPSRSSPS